MNLTALSEPSVYSHTLEVPTKIVLNLLVLTGMAFAEGQTHTALAVSAVVRAAARIEVQSATSFTVFATMYPNAEGLVWPAEGFCSAPENPKVIAVSGLHHLSFSREEVQGKDMICFVSSDGLLHTSTRLRP